MRNQGASRAGGGPFGLTSGGGISGDFGRYFLPGLHSAIVLVPVNALAQMVLLVIDLPFFGSG